MVSFSQVSVKHRAAEFEKLFVRESRRSSSVLLGREPRFARWMLGNGVLNPLAKLHERPGTLPPSARPVVSKQHRSSANYNVQQSVRVIKIRKRFCGVFCRMFSSSSLVKLIVFEKQKTGKKQKQYKHWRAKHSSCHLRRHHEHQGRISTVKMNLLPRFNFFFSMLPLSPPPGYFKEINSIISKFIWNDKCPRIKLTILQHPNSAGGLAVPNLELYYWSFQLKARCTVKHCTAPSANNKQITPTAFSS